MDWIDCAVADNLATIPGFKVGFHRVNPEDGIGGVSFGAEAVIGHDVKRIGGRALQDGRYALDRLFVDKREWVAACARACKLAGSRAF